MIPPRPNYTNLPSSIPPHIPVTKQTWNTSSAITPNSPTPNNPFFNISKNNQGGIGTGTTPAATGVNAFNSNTISGNPLASGSNSGGFLNKSSWVTGGAMGQQSKGVTEHAPTLNFSYTQPNSTSPSGSFFPKATPTQNGNNPITPSSIFPNQSSNASPPTQKFGAVICTGNNTFVYKTEEKDYKIPAYSKNYLVGGDKKIMCISAVSKHLEKNECKEY